MEQPVGFKARLSNAKKRTKARWRKKDKLDQALSRRYGSRRKSKKGFINCLKSSRRQQIYNGVSQASSSTAHINSVHDHDANPTTSAYDNGADRIIPVSSLQSLSATVDPTVPGTSTHDSLDYIRHDKYSTGIHIPVSRMRLKVVAIDCEMVGCIRKDQLAEQVEKMLPHHINDILKMKPRRKKKIKEISIAARCSIIDYNGSSLYERYINPAMGTEYKIKDYRTPWSGIRPFHMEGATPFNVAKEEIMKILKDCIVVGHQIWTDFHSLEIYSFPTPQIRDTSVHPKLKAMAGLPANKQPGALKKMTLALLKRHIQTYSQVGHCSIEDATATMDLYKLVEQEWER